MCRTMGFENYEETLNVEAEALNVHLARLRQVSHFHLSGEERADGCRQKRRVRFLLPQLLGRVLPVRRGRGRSRLIDELSLTLQTATNMKGHICVNIGTKNLRIDLNRCSPDIFALNFYI